MENRKEYCDIHNEEFDGPGHDCELCGLHVCPECWNERKQHCMNCDSEEDRKKGLFKPGT